MWIMLWIIPALGAGVGTGSAEFTSKDACWAARGEMLRMVQDVERANKPLGAPSIRCFDKTTGKM